MAGNAVLRCGFEVCQGFVIIVALPASYLGMIPFQLECDGIVIEIMTEGIYSIMTCQTICPEILKVILRKTGINLGMTSAAIALVITGVALSMAIDTNELRSIAFNLVSG
jgi:hypothetical protein